MNPESSVCFVVVTTQLTFLVDPPASFTSSSRRRIQPVFLIKKKRDASFPLQMCTDSKNTDQISTTTTGTVEIVNSTPAATTVVNSEQENKLLQLALAGDVRGIEKLVGEADETLNIDAVDENGRSPLHFVAALGIPSICTLLLEKGADINRPDIQGFTPLHMAAGYKRVQTVQCLVDAGADREIQDMQNQTPAQLIEKMVNNMPDKKLFGIMKNKTKETLTEILAILQKS